jgi:hypothetical protein
MITTSRNNKSWLNKKYKRGLWKRIRKCGYGDYGDYIESEIVKMISEHLSKNIDTQIIKEIKRLAIDNSI